MCLTSKYEINTYYIISFKNLIEVSNGEQEAEREKSGNKKLNEPENCNWKVGKSMLAK